MRSLAYFIGTFVVALMLGIGSAWYTIERGTLLTTAKVGPWSGWVTEGNPNADPYTKAHVARSGRPGGPVMYASPPIIWATSSSAVRSW